MPVAASYLAMWWAIVIVTITGCAVDDGNRAAVDHASCTVRASAGMLCREYSYQYPDELNAIAAGCEGGFAEDRCSKGDAIGICRLSGYAVDFTRIYKGYRDVPGFIDQCRSSNGTWEPD